MSDVEKAISGLVEDEELLQQQQQQQQKQSRTASNKININNYNLENETGNSSLLQKHRSNNVSQHLHHQDSNIQQDPHTHANYLTVQQHHFLSRVAKLLFSTPGLVVMVVVYTVMGAFIFPLLEAPQDISKSAIIAKSREECLKELWIITEKLNVLYERNWTMLVHEQLRRFEGTIVAATRNMAAGATAGGSSAGMTAVGIGGGGGEGMATETTTTSLERYSSNTLMEYSDLTTNRWSFSEALLYSITVITTIGHGSLTPRTAAGKIATIFYALIGVPLMLMCLSSLGALLADALQSTYARLCCRWPQYEMNRADDLDKDATNSKHSQQTQRFKCQASRLSRTEMNVENETSHQLEQHLRHQCDYQKHKNDINCKNCKYDAVIGERNTSHGYEYKMCNDATTTAVAAATTVSSSLQLSSPLSSSNTATTTTSSITTATATTTMKLGHREDCCQLLQNSPGKFTQHLSSCMQLKMSPTKTQAESVSATDTTKAVHKQQQQYYQHRPDVMLMTTGHKLSLQQPATMAAACSMALPPTLPSSQAQRFYANATPAMATYHLVSSASANSSPTHHQPVRHYLMPPFSPIPPSSSCVTGAQHFVAVPSSMVRFHHQTSPQTSIQQQPQQQQPQDQQCSVNTTTNININPLPLPVSGTATVYFPIVAPAAAGSQNSTQPLTKYHTIQLPRKRQQGLTLLQHAELSDNQVMNVIEDVDDALFPPPPPPAYQTATVHGIRRAKFLTKPLPLEINNLLQESDIASRPDLSHNLTTFSTNSSTTNSAMEQQQLAATTTVFTTTATSTATAAIATKTTTTPSMLLSNENGKKLEAGTAVGNFNVASTTSTATLTHNTTNIYENHSLQQQQQQQQQHVHAVNNQTGLIANAGVLNPDAAAVAIVDIMEDEEELEQLRLGNCPYGTPSRVPLLTAASSSCLEDKSNTRSFLNATASSIQRHTLNTFQRSQNTLANQRKCVIINHKGECNLHVPKRRNSSSGALSYGDQYDDTSDDDCGGLEGGNIYKLKYLKQHVAPATHIQTDKPLAPADFCDNHSLMSLSDSMSQIPQVPIVVVLIILTFYVCLGTVIFALWENWSLIDGAYFCFVTLTTIGYGDFVPWKTFQGPEIQLFACCAYLLLGLVLVAMSFSILETQLIWKCKRLAVRLKLAKE